MRYLQRPGKAIRLSYVCTDPAGLHARPAGQFVKEAGAFASAITVINGEKSAEAGSILSLLGLGIRQGDRFEVIIGGTDQEAAALTADAFFQTIAQRDSLGDPDQAPALEQTAPELSGKDSKDAGCRGDSKDAGGRSNAVGSDGMITMQGTGGSGGIAIGPVYLFDPPGQNSGQKPDTNSEKNPHQKPECGKAGTKSASIAPQLEWERFLSAREKAVSRIRVLEQKACAEGLTDAVQLLEAHRMMTEDLELGSSVKRKILDEGMQAERAVRATAAQFAAMLSSADSACLRAREADVRDVTDRITDILAGTSQRMIDSPIPVILFADRLTPGQILQMDRRKILGLVMTEGSVLSHTAILARTMGIPAVFGIDLHEAALHEAAAHEVAARKAAAQADAKRTVIVDGDTGSVILNPDERTLAKWRERLEAQRAEEEELRSMEGLPGITKDGRRIQVLCNIQLPQEVDMALENDAEGIGLFRSEFLFLGREDLPSEEEQYEAYRHVLERMEGRVVTIRTIDIGADKNAPCLDLAPETNPAPGNRALRFCLGRPEIFRMQLRALYRASVHGKLRIMFPMVTSVWEVQKARRICGEVQAQLAAEGIPYDSHVPLGIMIETPAAALVSDLLAKEADFFSCGTNDLTQYTLACDRQSAQLPGYYDAHHPAVLRLLRTVCENARQAGISVSICGNLAADLEMTEYFARIGISELSVPPGSVLKVRRQIREVSAD